MFIGSRVAAAICQLIVQPCHNLSPREHCRNALSVDNTSIFTFSI